MTAMRDVRPRLDAFVDMMRAKLAQPRNQQKSDWRDMRAPELLRALEGAVRELRIAMRDDVPDAAAWECVDVANRAMMLADRLQLERGRRAQPRTPSTPLGTDLPPGPA